jgi:hypothetical protein
VDTHSKLNQAFAVLALERLATLTDRERDALRLPASHSLAEVAREGNPQGILATLDEIEAHPAQWEIVLGAAERAHINLLRQRLADARAEDEAQEYQRTREAHLDPTRLADFRRELQQTFLKSGRFRKIVEAEGRLVLRLGDEPSKSVPSLGINQLDDKNAFIAQDRVSYAGWGRGYGEGLATGEDEAAFAAMINGAGLQQEIGRGTLVSSISTILTRSAMAEPIVFQSLAFEIEYPEIRQNPAFTPKFDPQLRSRWKEFNSFMGVLTVANQQVPVFDVFAKRPESQNKIVLTDLNRFLQWTQFGPGDTSDESPDVDGPLLIRVIDLNLDAEKRNQLISANPPWLAEKEDKEGYLCGQVLVNVYEKFRIDILKPEAGVCLTLNYS